MNFSERQCNCASWYRAFEIDQDITMSAYDPIANFCNMSSISFEVKCHTICRYFISEKLSISVISDVNHFVEPKISCQICIFIAFSTLDVQIREGAQDPRWYLLDSTFMPWYLFHFVKPLYFCEIGRRNASMGTYGSGYWLLTAPSPLPGPLPPWFPGLPLSSPRGSFSSRPGTHEAPSQTRSWLIPL